MRLAPVLLLGVCALGAAPAEPDGLVAEARADGVVVEARAGAWDHEPARLGTEVTPIWVRVENHSPRALELRWAGFVVEAEDGAHVALPPPDDDERLYGSRRYVELPADARFEEAFGRDLPAGDLGAAALREGVLAPGGEASGYLYFDPCPGRITLHVQLADARTGGAGVDLAVPFAGRELAQRGARPAAN